MTLAPANFFRDRSVFFAFDDPMTYLGRTIWIPGVYDYLNKKLTQKFATKKNYPDLKSEDFSHHIVKVVKALTVPYIHCFVFINIH